MPDTIRIVIEDTAGERFECDISRDTSLSKLTADFFEDRGWPTRDARGRGNRAVVELVDPENPDRTKRLDGEQTIDGAGLFDGAVLRMFPEAVAGMVNEQERIRALEADLKDIQELVKWNSHVKFEARPAFAPTLYTISFDYPSFSKLSADDHTPVISDEHRVEILMGGDYPRSAPLVKWLTPIFHPNIRQDDGAVCLGALMDRWLPSMGLARLVTMLAEMVRYRNFDAYNPFNKEAAEWVKNAEHAEFIEQIGGYPFQRPVSELLDELEKMFQVEGSRPRIGFKRVTSERNES